MNPSDIQKIALLEDRLRKLTTDFKQSREFIRLFSGYTQKPEERGGIVSLDIKDQLVLGAITNSDVLFTGKSGGGKTHLAKMGMNAFFGKGQYVNRTITPGMNEEAFIDIDFGKIKDGNTLRQAISTTPILTMPGVIFNEANRAPALIQNILIPYLEYEFNIKGLDFDVGLPSPIGGRYQYRILTINEGSEYKGISEMDKAVRDRMVIEVPIDQFKSLRDDIRDMIKKRKSSSITVEDNKDSMTKTVLDLYKNISEIPLTPKASEFLIYLSGLSNCIQSKTTGSKEGIAFSLEMCKGCKHASKENNICGNVYAPTHRSLINLQSVGKGIAALRAYKTLTALLNTNETDSRKARIISSFMKSDYVNNLAVTAEDIMAIAPFILYSKIQINDQWVKKFYQGNKFAAVTGVLNTAYTRCSQFFIENVAQIMQMQRASDIKGRGEFYKKIAEEKDPWLANIKDLENRTEEYSANMGDLIGGYNGN